MPLELILVYRWAQLFGLDEVYLLIGLSLRKVCCNADFEAYGQNVPDGAVCILDVSH